MPLAANRPLVTGPEGLRRLMARLLATEAEIAKQVVVQIAEGTPFVRARDPQIEPCED